MERKDPFCLSVDYNFYIVHRRTTRSPEGLNSFFYGSLHSRNSICCGFNESKKFQVVRIMQHCIAFACNHPIGEGIIRTVQDLHEREKPAPKASGAVRKASTSNICAKLAVQGDNSSTVSVARHRSRKRGMQSGPRPRRGGF